MLEKSGQVPWVGFDIPVPSSWLVFERGAQITLARIRHLGAVALPRFGQIGIGPLGRLQHAGTVEPAVFWKAGSGRLRQA